MSQRFVQGKTNHLNWVMVDATDFATPESALSAAMKIKIYGQLDNAAVTNFVSSGTGSLTNDITHVGASATGCYHIALATADLSDASAAFYDVYIVHLSATGAAYQTLVVPGDRVSTSYISNMLSDIKSTMDSQFAVVSNYLSNASNYLSNLSALVSDVDSALTSQYTAGHPLTASDISDIRSAIAAGPAATVTASDISDIASAVRAILVSDLSDILSAAQQTNSRVLVVQSMVSDVDSALTSQYTAGQNLNASTISDIRSAISAGPAATVTASDISDIASAVWANTIGARVDSRILVAQSYLSDIRSDVSDMHSDLIVMSGILSDAYSAILLVQSAASDAASGVTVLLSRVTSAVATSSDMVSKIWAHATAASLVSRVSDIQSALDSQYAAGQNLNASTISDIRSAISAGPAATVTASDISDIASAVKAILASDISDILSAAQQTNSRALVVQSRVSDVESALDSQFAVTTSYLSDIRSDVSDMHSDIIVMSGVLSDVYSNLTRAIPELAVGAPTATPTYQEGIMAVYMALRNKVDVNSTFKEIHNNAGSVVFKKALTDNGSVYSEAEAEAGP